MLGLHAIEEVFHLRRVRVIDLYRNADATAARDFLGGLFDGAGDFVDGRGTATDGTAGDIDRGALFA